MTQSPRVHTPEVVVFA